MRKELVIKTVIALVLTALVTGVLMYIDNRPAPTPVGNGNYTPGTYIGEGQGFGGTVTVEITTDATTITDVKVTGDSETPDIGGAHLEELAGQIKAAQSADIDGVTSATMTSNGVKEAAAAAIALAEGKSVPTSGPTLAEEFKAGTYSAEARGFGGIVTAAVTVAEDKSIESVDVEGPDETPNLGAVAVERLPAKIVAAQSTQIDGVTGATITSNAIFQAVDTALMAAGLDPAALVPQKADSGEKTAETLDCDIVIVGAGGAGLTAACQAAELGAKVIILEKMPLVGGNSLKATGGMNAAATAYQAELGITDSGVQEFIEDTMNGGHQINDIDLVTTMAEESAEAVDWLTSIGAPLPEVAATGGTQHKYLHEPEDGSAVGPYLVEKLSKQAEKLGIQIILETTVTEIIMDNGAAAGVKAASDMADYTVNAKVVILATGGFGSNYDIMTSYNPSLAGAVTTNHAGATGDGITMAEAVGADTVDMEQIQLHPTVYQETGLLVSESVRSKGGILVNSSGKRFCNDMSTRDAVSAAELEQDGQYAYIIFDQRLVDGLKSTQKYISNGLTVSADTYAGLAEAMGLTGDAVSNFEETMATWNAAVAAGEDKEFGRNNGMDEDLSVAPFYAIKIAPGIHHTMGGIKIDTETRVIDTEGQPIPKLFAAGETVGGVHGGNRIGGNAVCDFVVFGRIAGKNAVESIAAAN